jgi:glutathione S-transferase
MIQIWGRQNSINTQKVFWCCDELNLKYERVAAGRGYGQVDTPEYYKLNPNRKVPTLVDGDYMLWESNSIMRYLDAKVGGSTGLYPTETGARAIVDQWLDWVLSTLHVAGVLVNTSYFGVPKEKRDLAKTAEGLKTSAPVWKILDEHLAGRRFVTGDHFTIADIGIGVYARRWFGVPEVEIPHFQNLAAWYKKLEERPGLQNCFVE